MGYKREGRRWKPAGVVVSQRHADQRREGLCAVVRIGPELSTQLLDRGG